MKTTLLSFAFFAIVAFGNDLYAQNTIVAWTFDNGDSIPSQGNGIITPDNITTRTFDKKGITPYTATDEGTPDDNTGLAYNTTGYPEQGVGSKTAGVRIEISTTNYKDISIKADMRPSSSAPRNMVLQYSLDGNQWTDATSFETPDVLPTAGNANKWYPRNFDLKGITQINNQAKVYLRYVTAFAPGTSEYVVMDTKSYASSCAIRIDNITIKGIVSTGVSHVDAETLGVKVVGRKLIFENATTDAVNVYSISGMHTATFDKGITAAELTMSAGIYIVKYRNNAFKVALH